jgi:transposase-like protein
MATRSTMTASERVELVLRLLRREEPAVQLARRSGISEQTLYRWRDEFIAAGKLGLGGGGNGASAMTRQVERLERELAERDRVIGELTIANRLLKKGSGRLS